MKPAAMRFGAGLAAVLLLTAGCSSGSAEGENGEVPVLSTSAAAPSAEAGSGTTSQDSLDPSDSVASSEGATDLPSTTSGPTDSGPSVAPGIPVDLDFSTPDSWGNSTSDVTTIKPADGKLALAVQGKSLDYISLTSDPFVVEPGDPLEVTAYVDFSAVSCNEVTRLGAQLLFVDKNDEYVGETPLAAPTDGGAGEIRFSTRVPRKAAKAVIRNFIEGFACTGTVSARDVAATVLNL